MRSTRTSRHLALLAALAATALAAPAARAAEVPALPAAGDAPALSVRTAGAELCLQARGLTASTSDGHRTTCGDPTLRDDEVAVTGTTSDLRGSSFVGIVPSGVAAVRVAFPGGSRPVVAPVPVPGLPAPFTGRIAAFRVAVPRAPAPAGIDGDSEQEASWVQALDASGRIVGVASPSSTQGAPRVGPTRVRRLVRRAGTTVLAVSYTEEALAPTVADVGRTQLRACLDVVARRGGPDGSGEGSGGASCVTGLGSDPFDLAIPIEGCGPRLGGVQGPLPPGTTGAAAVLGDGSRVRLPLTSLAPAAPGRVAVAYVAPADQAVRAVELAPSGRRIPLGVGPAQVSCAGTDPRRLRAEGFIYETDGSAVPRVPAPLASPLAPLGGGLSAAEGPQGTLCLTLGTTPPATADCAALSRAPGAALLVRGRLAGGRAVVAGVTGPRAASVRIGIPDARPGRRSIVVPTVPGAPGAGGAYAGRLRTFATTLPATELPSTAEGRDVAGRALEPRGDSEPDDGTPVLGDTSGARVSALVQPPSRAIGRVGPAVVWRAAVRSSGTTLRCGAVTLGRRPGLLDVDCPQPGVARAAVVARCGPAGLVVSLVTRGSARLVATTRAGRTLRARRFPVGGGAAVAVLALGRRTGLRALAVTRSPEARRVRVDLRAARTQCGYATSLSLAPPDPSLG